MARLAALHRMTFGAFCERRSQHPEGSPTRLQEFVLLALRDRGGMQVSELVALLEVSTATTSQLLASMEEKGWIRREMLAEDRRRHRVTVTPAGEGLVAEMEARRADGLRRVLAQLSGKERAQLVAIAERVVQVLAEGEPSLAEVL